VRHIPTAQPSIYPACCDGELIEIKLEPYESRSRPLEEHARSFLQPLRAGN